MHDEIISKKRRENSAILPISFRQDFFYEFLLFYRENYKIISYNR